LSDKSPPKLQITNEVIDSQIYRLSQSSYENQDQNQAEDLEETKTLIEDDD